MAKLMRNFVFGTLIAASLGGMSILPAQAGITDLYVRLDSGYSLGAIESHYNQDEKIGNSLIYGGTIGYQLGDYVPGLSLELGLSYRGDFAYESKVTKTDSFSNLLVPMGTMVKADSTAITFIPQLVYRLPLIPFIKPYVTGGVGFSMNKSSNAVLTYPEPKPVTDFTGVPAGTKGTVLGGKIKDTTNNALAYSFGVGLEFTVLPLLDIQLGYRYLNLGAFKTSVASPLTPTLSSDTPASLLPQATALASEIKFDDRKPYANEIVVGVGLRF